MLPQQYSCDSPISGGGDGEGRGGDGGDRGGGGGRGRQGNKGGRGERKKGSREGPSYKKFV